MCVIAFTDTRAMTRKEFDNCWESNPDGFGMAWRETRKGITLIKVKKGIMRRNEAWEEYRKVKDERVTMHFRIKTAGEICPELTHPFMITKKSPIQLEYSGVTDVLFHNGMIYAWQDTLLKYMLNSYNKISGHMSDSRWIAIQMALEKDAKSGREFLEKQTGKYVVVTKNSVYLFGEYIEKKGIFYSNSSYLDRVVVSNKSYYGWKSQSYEPKDKGWRDTWYEEWNAGKKVDQSKKSKITDFDDPIGKELFDDPFYYMES